jgi:hypothetical protein
MSLFSFIAGFFGRMMFHKLGAAGFWANRGKRIAVPLVIGWVILFPLIAWIWTVGVAKTLGGAAPAMPEMPKTPGAFPLTHLWFLYQLLVLYAAVLGLRAIALKTSAGQKLRDLADRLVPGSISSLTAVFVLGVPLAVTLIWLPMWFYWQGIPTPDQSLIPQLPATVGFGTAFVFGWLVQRSAGSALEAMTKRAHHHLLIATGATAYLLYVVHTTPMAQPGLTKNAFAFAFGVALWGWVIGLTGTALRFMSNYSAVRRYSNLADRLANT